MTKPTTQEQRELLRRRREGYEIAERLRYRQLRGMPYRWEDVDALLELGDLADLPPRTSSGLIEMQRRLHQGRNSTE